MKGIYIFFLLLFQCLPAQLSMERYTKDNELFNNNVRDIIKDKYGFIWFSTEKGIVRYDGVRFLVQNSTGLGNMSFGNFYGSIENDSIVNFNFLEKDVLLISRRKTKQIKVEKINNKRQIENGRNFLHFIKNNMPSNHYSDINDYFIKTNNETYFFSDKTIYYKKSNTKDSVKIPLKFENKDLSRVFMIENSLFFSDAKNNKIIKIENGMISKISAPSVLLNPKSVFFWHQTTGQSFVIHQDNIYMIHKEKGRLSTKFLLHYSNIGKEGITSILYDNESQKFFFGSPNKGLSVVPIPSFSVTKKNIPYADEIYYAALPFSKNSIITEEGWVYSKNGARKLFNNDRIPDKFYLNYDNNKNLVYKGYYYISKRYKEDNYRDAKDVAIFKSRVEGIYKSNGGLFASLADNAEKRFVYVFRDDSFQSVKSIIQVPDYVFSIYRHSDDLLYISCNRGLYLASISQKKIVKTIVKGFSVKHVIKTNDGNLWFTTFGQGLFYLKNDVAKKLPLDPEENMRTAHFILEDKKGYFWISSNNGLFKVRKRNLLNYIEGTSNKEVVYFRYTKESGFLNNEFNGSSFPCATALDNGEFVFPSMDGFVFFNPEKTKSYYPSSSQFFLENMIINDRQIFFKDKVHLKSNYKKADFYIDLPYFSDLSNIYLQYKINEEKNATWKTVSKEKKIAFDERNPGKYTLLIRFISSEKESFVYKKVFIVVEPMYYQTWWFKLSVLIVFSVILLTLIQIRTNFLRLRYKNIKNTLYNRNNELHDKERKLYVAEVQLERELDFQQRLTESISHDITTPIKFITMLSEKLEQESDENLQKEYLNSIYLSSKQLFYFTKELKNYSNLYKQTHIIEREPYNLFPLLETKKNLFEQICLQKGISINNFCNPEINTIVNRNILSTIIHNIIDNAVKYTSFGKIVIEVVDKQESLIIKISDTGHGMSTEQLEYYNLLSKNTKEQKMVFKNFGLGLHMIVRLVKKINADIRFKRNYPLGIIVEIELNN